jgi:serine/threonine-protein kinase
LDEGERMRNSCAEENLLFGVLALQMDFISREQLIAAATGWMLDKSKPLGEILLAQGAIDDESRELLQKMIRKHLELHDNDPGKSLAGMGPLGSLRDDLHSLDDDDIDATLVHFSGTEERASAPVAGSQSGTQGEAPDATEAFQPSDEDHRFDETQVYPSGTQDDGSPSAVDFKPGLARSAHSRFRVIRPHAKGGLGLVSVAMDEELYREVAFKELQEHCANDLECQGRFLLEAEITGRLEHPGVVPIYGLGARADGRPFYAMRFIRGESLKKAIAEFHKTHADGRDPGQYALGLRNLLRRFIDVCNTMQYAHSRGIVHRDLKPENVMLGKYGETLVVDWGAAKSVHRPEDSPGSDEVTLRPVHTSGSAYTQMGSVIGTPVFMSPEQAEGRSSEVGPLSDVYSLGSTLYALLTNHRPCAAETVLDVLENVRSGKFVKPRQINPRISAALEAVCVKAMALKPEDRYANPRALAEDIEHWMADEPVSAHQDTFGERAGRWMRRHRNWVQAGVAALLLVSLVSAAATLLVNRARKAATNLAEQNLILAAERGAAREEALDGYQRARRAVDTWLTGIPEALKYFPGVLEARHRLQQMAAEEYERFAQKHYDDVELELERGRAYLRLGDVRRALNEQPQAEEAYRSAEALFQELAASHADMPDCQLELANSHTKLGLVLAETGSTENADGEYRRAADRLRKLAEEHPGEPRFRDALGAALLNRGALLVTLQRRPEAVDLLRQAVDLFENLGKIDPAEPKHLEDASRARSVLSVVLADEGNHDDALVEISQAANDLDDLVRIDPENAGFLETRASGQVYLAGVLRSVGKHDEEIGAYRQAIDDYQTLRAVRPDVPLYREGSAIAGTDFGQLLHELGRNAEAHAELTRALETFTELIGEYPRVYQYHQELALCRDNLGEVLGDLGRNEEAKSEHEAALDVFEQFSHQFPDVREFWERQAVSRSHLAGVLHKLGLHDQAKEQFSTAVGTMNELIQADPDVPRYRNELAFIHSHLGVLCQHSQETVEAEKAFQTALELWEGLAAQTPSPEYLHNLAKFLTNCPHHPFRNPQRAIQFAKKASDMAPKNTLYRSTLGEAYYRAGNWRDAVATLQEAMRLRGEGSDRNWFFLAMAERKQGKSDEEQPSYDNARKWMDENRPDNRELKAVRSEAAELLGVPEPDLPQGSDTRSP